MAVVLVGILAASCGRGASSERATDGTRERYLHGVNMPWYNWRCDFGCGSDGGVSSTGPVLEERFAALQAAGIGHVRWWLFEGDAWQVERDERGAPLRVKPSVYADIDAAVALGRRYDLSFTFVLFSSPGSVPGGWLNDPKARQRLGAALTPLFRRYALEPHIFAWEVFNEPEWEMWSGQVNPADVQETVRVIAKAVHDAGAKRVTVGSAALDGLPFWTGMGLDFYQVHWYDEMTGPERCVRCTDYAAVRERYGLDAPLVIGEFYGGADVDARARYEEFYAKGFAGAWAWSLWPERTDDRLAIDLNAAREFSRAHAEALEAPPGCRAAGDPARRQPWTLASCVGR